MPTVLLVPGLGCDAAQYRPQVAAIEDLPRWQAVVADLGEGDSVASMADRVLAVCPERVVLVGTSLGGYVSLEVARRVPARLLGLVLISTSARADPPSAALVRDAFDRRVGDGDLSGLASDVAERSVGAGAESRPEVVATVRAMLERVGAEVALRHSRAARDRPDQREHLADLTMPALVMAGEEDVIVPARVTRELAAALPGASYFELTGGGHVLTLERPRLVNDALTAFLRPLA